MLERIARAVRQRPIRALEAVLALVAVAGLTVGPDVEEAARNLVGLLAAVGVVGGEVVQKWYTNSRDYVEDELLDAETDGPPGSHLHAGGS